MTLQQIATHADLLQATEDSTFVRYDLPTPLEGTGYVRGGAVAVPRRTHARGLGLLVMGPSADVGQLVGTMVADGVLPPDLRSVTVQRDALGAVATHLPLTDGNDWEWLCIQQEPSQVPAEPGLVGLDDRDLDDVRRLLDVANPNTDARPFELPGQHWAGIRIPSGELVACGVREANLAGWPVLFGISVHPDHRGTGLGLAVTAYLTRAAVRERGVCTLGMYSHNDVARRLYLGLGYGDVHQWSSRRLAG
jgi:ribosomal protein S18 acetylase RimI-like enzyme